MREKFEKFEIYVNEHGFATYRNGEWIASSRSGKDLIKFFEEILNIADPTTKYDGRLVIQRGEKS